MRIVALGTFDETRGLALAGVETMHCENEAEADGLIASMTSPNSDVALVLLSRSVAPLANSAIERARSEKAAAVFLVLPWG